MKNLFEEEDKSKLIERVNQLNVSSVPQWGKMNVAQMLAHCNVAFDMVYTDRYPIAKGLKKFMLTTFVKNTVVGDKPYKKNSRTAPVFIVANERVFEKERAILIDYINRVNKDGVEFFENKASNSFGKLSSYEWNNLFVKHLDHHLNQFGV